jgi:tRNA-uridine 2-sulfurtransferase
MNKLPTGKPYLVQFETGWGSRTVLVASSQLWGHVGAMNLPTAIIDAVHAAMDLPGAPASHRVVCAMSGGVDSSVVAGLLKVAGYDVVGITLQLYDHGEAIRRKGACCAGQDIHDARRVSSALGIPHYVLDFESRFKDAVIDEFVASYLQGATPIPCIKCNQTVKFADLLARAKDMAASALVTGHYIESRQRAGTRHRDLFTPADTARDQSYFLYATTQDQIDYLRFPLGTLTKPQVREVAEALGLTVAAKPDSQDICFVPEGRYTDVILKLRPDAAEAGEILHLDGRVLGTHAGIIHFTIGQRRGLGIADAEPLFVVRLDAARKHVIVGPREALKQHDVPLVDVNWLGHDKITAEPQPVFVKIRSTRDPIEASITHVAANAIVKITAGEYAISPGQACVFYDGQGPGKRVLGGGTIQVRH